MIASPIVLPSVSSEDMLDNSLSEVRVVSSVVVDMVGVLYRLSRCLFLTLIRCNLTTMAILRPIIIDAGRKKKNVIQVACIANKKCLSLVCGMQTVLPVCL